MQYAVFLPKKMTRLIEWNADVLLRLLKQIAAADGPQRLCEDVLQTSSTTGESAG
jgi:hypothetical protein